MLKAENEAPRLARCRWYSIIDLCVSNILYGDTKRQLGVPEEALEERWATPRTPSLSANGGSNRGCVVRSEVGKTSVLQVAPDLLLRIEFGGVAREPERMPVRVLVYRTRLSGHQIEQHRFFGG